MQELISKAEALLEALPYLQRFRARLLSLNMAAVSWTRPRRRDAPAWRGMWFSWRRRGLARCWFMAAARRSPPPWPGRDWRREFLQGMRVTDEAAARVVERVLSQEINPQIVNTINGLGGRAKGFSGTEIFTCRKLWLSGAGGERLDPGFVGEVVAVKTEPLRECVRNGIIPVVSPTARGQDGQVYNCNADVAAAQAAIALQAQRLVFMSDVPGLLRDAKDPKTLISRLSAGEVEGLKKSGVIDQGMIPKVDSAVAALRAGVGKVSFVDGRVAHAVLLEMFTEEALGTEIVL